MDLKKTGLALLLANCAEPSLHLDSISETVGQLHLQSEEKVKKLEAVISQGFFSLRKK